MNSLHTVGKVFEGVQTAKSGATDFRTNFFPVPSKLEAWIAQDELLGVVRDGAAFFFRKDRDFWHFYYCAASLTALRRELTTLYELRSEPMVTDLVGNESAIGDVMEVLQEVGFRHYARLQRMSRAAWPGSPQSAPDNVEVVCAEKADCQAILNLIDSEFDRYAEQPPRLCEVESAAEQGNILTAKLNDQIGGLLFFETQGQASTIRYWVVEERYRAFRIGSALMLHYLATQKDVHRFTLWVNANNENAIQKYGHYGYACDGLLDLVLANRMIPS